MGRRPIFQLAVLIAFMVMAVPAFAQDEFSHPGYLDNVAEERAQVTREVVIVPFVNETSTELMDEIFTEKMSKEFSKEFRNRFGYTEFEQLSFTSNRFVESGDSGQLVPVDEYIDKQEDFGQYMAKELTEYHVDKYLRGNKATRNVYKVKEAISNVEVKTKAGYKFKFRYKLSSNRATFKMEKPNEKFHKQFEVKSNGDNPTVKLAYDVSKTVVIGTDYAIDDEVLSVRGEKRLTDSLRTSITGQSFNKDVGDTPKQERVLLGLSWND